MRLVDNHEVPYDGLERAHGLRTFHVVDRRDSQRVRRPRIRSRHRSGPRSGERRRIEHHRGKAEPVAQLAAPLLAEGGWRDDQDVRIGAALERLGGDEARLYRLTEPDFVGNQDPRGNATDHGKGRFQLKGQKVDAGACEGPQRVVGRRGFGKQPPRLPPPPPGRDDTCGLDEREGMNRLEREDEPRVDAAIRAAASLHLDDRGGRVRDMTPDGPALVADADDVAAAERGSGHAAQKCRRRASPRPTTYAEFRREPCRFRNEEAGRRVEKGRTRKRRYIPQPR